MHIYYIFRHLTISETLVDWPWTCWSKLPCIRSDEIIPHQWRAILGKRRSYSWFTGQVKLHPSGRSFHEFSNYLCGNARCELCKVQSWQRINSSGGGLSVRELKNECELSQLLTWFEVIVWKLTSLLVYGQCRQLFSSWRPWASVTQVFRISLQMDRSEFKDSEKDNSTTVELYEFQRSSNSSTVVELSFSEFKDSEKDNSTTVELFGDRWNSYLKCKAMHQISWEW